MPLNVGLHAKFRAVQEIEVAEYISGDKFANRRKTALDG